MVQRLRRLVHIQETMVQLHPGLLLTKWSGSVSAGTARRVVHRCGKAEDRGQFPDGPLEFRDAGLTGRLLGCPKVIGVRFPPVSFEKNHRNGEPCHTFDGPIVNQDNRGLARHYS